MDTTDLQLTDYLQTLQVTLNSHHEGCRIVMLEAGSDTQVFDRFIDRQFRLRLQHYMLTSRARMLETQLATRSRSTHFLLYRHEQLLAVLRATPRRSSGHRWRGNMFRPRWRCHAMSNSVA